MPDWMKWTIVVSVILIALACISNSVYNICFAPDNSTSSATTWKKTDDANSTMVVPIQDDSIQVQPVPQIDQQDSNGQPNAQHP